MLPERYRYVVVEGPIGVGKTSLALRLAQHIGSATLLEKPDENPFLARFYQDPPRYALATQLFFLFQRGNEVRDLAQMDMFREHTVEMETVAEKMIADAGAKPAFKGYYVPAAGEAYKFVLCTSGEQRDRSRDAECEAGAQAGRHRFHRHRGEAGRLQGYGDSAITVPIGEVSEHTPRSSSQVTQESLDLAIDQAAGNGLFDVCGTVERHVQSNGFSVVREYVGHGTSAPSSMKSRRFRTTWTARTRIRG